MATPFKKTRSARHFTSIRVWAVAASVVAVGLAAGVGMTRAESATAAAKLRINPSTIYYPCNEGNVTFTVSNFAPSSQVTVEIGSSSAAPAFYIQTNSSGAGSTTDSFSNYYPGSYKIYATGSGLKASRTLTVGVCP